MVDQIANPLAGAKAYGAAQNLGVSSSSPSAESSVAGPSFGDILGSGIKNVIENVKESEKMSANAVTGKASLLDVTQAMSSAKLSVDSLTAFRDGAMDAYQRIMQMPI